MSETTISAAMAKAFAAIEGAQKDSNNPHFKTKYADLSSVVAAIKPALAANGLWFRQVTHEHAGGVCVETIVAHSSGGEISFGTLFVPASRNDAQGYGSALTYARRYSLMTAFGVCPEDDDGNAATAAPPKQAPPVEYITESQRDEIATLASAGGISLARICNGLGIASLKDLPADQFASVVKKLNLTIEQKKAKE
jgi:hypothetical protein